MALAGLLNSIQLLKMNTSESKSFHQETITLLSNGSLSIYNDNTLTFFSNKLQKRIKLDPFLHHYIALQEIGISLHSENIPLPNDKPSLYFFEWNFEVFESYFKGQYFSPFLSYKTIKNAFCLLI